MAQTVVVTGASGYIGTELTKQLLEKGYTVRATVRDKTAEHKVAHLKALGEALPGTLELWDADLLHEGAFDDVVKGSHYVFHTASPFFVTNVTDGQKQLVEPALKGTESVMHSVAKTQGVKRVVLTSSAAAIRGGASAAPPKNGSLYTDEDWNETSTVGNGEPYQTSKTTAEKAAWRIAKENGIDLVTIHPVFVIGPVISKRTDATTVQMIIDVLDGKPPPGDRSYVDVRDVARAHVLAAEIPEAKGRYIVANPTTSAKAVSDALQARYPEYDIVTGEPGNSKTTVDTSKTEQELGLKFFAPETTLVDMAATLLALGIANPKRKSS